MTRPQLVPANWDDCRGDRGGDSVALANATAAAVFGEPDTHAQHAFSKTPQAGDVAPLELGGTLQNHHRSTTVVA